MSEPPPPTVDDFDHTDVSEEVKTDPGKKTQADVDHEALVDLTKRVTLAETRLGIMEQREEREERLMRRLRKLLASWIGED